ncbi:hypothetical protein BCR44DRAFT_333965 [Catenaria anguillulae PL171]|uniref:Uncharacterized protein n=1 Tax=Catenaria anguillulae PL171 TaxID=765915 RepID=A0A1Y2H947_9FUNG|nr:hypothetical protein BCR44DRAFT_333965 [Catenaria anguillulae PL171]
MTSMKQSSCTIEHVWIWDTKAQALVAALRRNVKNSCDPASAMSAPAAMAPCPTCAGSEAMATSSAFGANSSLKFPSLKSAAQTPSSSQQSSQQKSLCSWLKNMFEPLATMSQLPDYLKFAQESLSIHSTICRKYASLMMVEKYKPSAIFFFSN